jgi:adenosylmethionine-8-amino-7-oxononanoate aminotransferase
MSKHSDSGLRAQTMELELTAALHDVRLHSFVQSVDVTLGPRAIVQLRGRDVTPDHIAQIVNECAQRKVVVEVIEGNRIVIAPELSISRQAVLAMGQALSDSLTAIGSTCSAPERPAQASLSSLTPHERDLLANVPPHHGE